MFSSPFDSTHGRLTSGLACPHGPWAAHTVNAERGITSLPVGYTRGRMKSGVIWLLCLETVHTVGRHRTWHAIIAIGLHTRSNDVRRGMLSWSLAITHACTMSGVARHYRPCTACTRSDNVEHGIHHRHWTTYTIRLHRVWHVIIALVLHTRLNVFGHGNVLISFGKHTRSKDVGSGMTSPPLGNTHGQTTSGVTCHHRL